METAYEVLECERIGNYASHIIVLGLFRVSPTLIPVDMVVIIVLVDSLDLLYVNPAEAHLFFVDGVIGPYCSSLAGKFGLLSPSGFKLGFLNGLGGLVALKTSGVG